MKRKGWVVWTWGKMGSLIVFMAMMAMMLSAYSFVGSSSQSDSANQLAANLKNLIFDTYNSAGGMSFEYKLPKSLDGEDYSIEIFDKEGDMVGIIVRTKSGLWELVGGSSLAIPLSERSFGTMKGLNEELHYICIVKHQGMIYLERSKCS